MIDDKIQKILKMIEIIEKFTDKFRKTKEACSNHVTQLSDELSFSNKFITGEDVQKTTVSDENHTGKSENLSAQLPRRISRLPNKLVHILTKSIHLIIKIIILS